MVTAGLALLSVYMPNLLDDYFIGGPSSPAEGAGCIEGEVRAGRRRTPPASGPRRCPRWSTAKVAARRSSTSCA